WMAGFHFNSGILRLAAVYHRSLKIAVDQPTTRHYAKTLRPIAKQRYPTWADKNADAVHVEVNELKHESKGLHEFRNVTPEQAIAAAVEIAELIESWAAKPWP